MRRSTYITIFIIINLITFVSCFKIITYPETPEVDFISFEIKDSLDILGNSVISGTLHFYFVDGDGDIGFDTIGGVKNTIFLEKYKIENGTPIKIDLLVPLNYYVPKFEKTGNNKTLKGEMFVYELNEYVPFEYDTIMYKFYIIDRAGNKSNVDSTGYIALKHIS